MGNKNFISEVDLFYGGLSKEEYTKDRFADLRNDDGTITIGRSKYIQEAENKMLVKEYMDNEKRNKAIKDMLGDSSSKDKIKDIKEDIKYDIEKKEKKKEKNKSYDTPKDIFYQNLPAELGMYAANGIDKDKDKKKKSKKEKKKEKKKHKERMQLEGFTIKEKKPKKGKDSSDSANKKKAKSEVAERFKIVEVMTEENIRLIDQTIKVVDERIEDLKSSDRVRGRDTALSNYIQAKSSLLSSRQKAATDILANRTKIYDIEIKQSRDATAATSTDADILAKVFTGINSGKYGDMIDKYVADNGSNKDSDKKKKKKKHKFIDEEGYDIDDNGFRKIEDDDELEKRERKLLKDDKIKYCDYDNNIQYENKFSVEIVKTYDNEKWKFIAVDGDRNTVKDVPESMLPDRNNTSMKWDDEKDTALDRNSGKAYKVTFVPAM